MDSQNFEKRNSGITSKNKLNITNTNTKRMYLPEIRGACAQMVIVVGNGHDDTSSNLRRG